MGPFVPKEILRPAARSENAGGRDSGIGGTGTPWWASRFRRGCGSSVVETSVEDGKVEEELKRAEDDELSLYPLVEVELSVAPLPLTLSQ